MAVGRVRRETVEIAVPDGEIVAGCGAASPCEHAVIDAMAVDGARRCRCSLVPNAGVRAVQSVDLDMIDGRRSAGSDDDHAAPADAAAVPGDEAVPDGDV